MAEYSLNYSNIDNIQAEVAFLSSGKQYNFTEIPEVLKQVIIFIPYCNQSNKLKAAAKKLALKFNSGQIDIILVDTKYTHKIARKCKLFYKEMNSTIALAYDYVQLNGYEPIIEGKFECSEKENQYLSQSQKAAEEKRSVLSAAKQ